MWHDSPTPDRPSAATSTLDPMPTVPTRVRYLIILVAMMAAMLLYLERVCLSVAEVYIREDLRIGKDRMDLVLGAFFYAYALGQVPSGWLSQRYGPRLMMTIYLFGWSVFGVFIARAQDFETLLAARFLLGLSQAGAYPTAALVVKRWVPDRRRGLASGIVSFGGRFGGAWANWLTGVLIVAFVPISTSPRVTPAEVIDVQPIANPNEDQVAVQAKTPNLDPVRKEVRGRLETTHPGPDQVAEAINAVIATPDVFKELDWSRVKLAGDGQAILAKPPADRTEREGERLRRLVVDRAFPGAFEQLHGRGWRPTLLLYGLLGIVAALIFWVVVRNWPRDHPWANQAEVDLIESGQHRAADQAGSDAVPWRLLATSRNQWLFSLTNFFANVGWVPLITLVPRYFAEQFSVPVDQRGLMTTIPLIVAAFAMLAGGWYTDRLTRTLGRRWGRAIPMGLFKLPCVIALGICPWLPGPWAVTVALTVMSFCQDFGVPSVWAFAQDTGGKQAATVLGWANMWGNFGAGIGPKLIGGVAVAYGWNAALLTMAASLALSGLAGLLTNAAEPLFRSDEAES